MIEDYDDDDGDNLFAFLLHFAQIQGGGDDDGDNDDDNDDDDDDGGDDTNYKATIIRWWMQQHFCASANRRQPLRSCWMDCVQLYMHQY